MATVAGIKIKTKQTKVRNPAFHDEKYTGGEPDWSEDDVNLSDADFDHKLRQSFYYYNYYYSQKDARKNVIEWLKLRPKEYTKEQVRAFERTSDKSIPMTACSLIMANVRANMPLKSRHLEFLSECILDAISKADPEPVEVATVEDKPVYKAPTIQDRLNEKTSEIIGELEGHYDDAVRNVKTNFKPYDFLVANNVVQSQIAKYEELYANRASELELARGRTEEQLVEGYKHYKAADFKRIIGWIDDLLAALEQYKSVKKASKKARVKKAPSKEKLIAKLKYAKTDPVLKIVSINPAEIVGASEVWVFNIKTRKLGRYVAGSYQTLSVKGTSIVNFDEQKSVSKTLRKPEVALKEFAKAGKVQLRKFLDDIKATETKMNGRINPDVVLLKAV
jgi:molecular chaperone GrpE (heat shock protein)